MWYNKTLLSKLREDVLSISLWGSSFEDHERWHFWKNPAFFHIVDHFLNDMKNFFGMALRIISK